MFSIYETEYSSKFVHRPSTTAVTRSFIDNPIQNNPISTQNTISEDKSIFQTSSTHEHFSKNSSIVNKKLDVPIQRAVMEKSGYWGDSSQISKPSKENIEKMVTTSTLTYKKNETTHERYWKIDQSLIGKKESNSYTKQHVFIPKKSETDYISTNHVSFKGTFPKPSVSIPNSTVVEDSGFSKAAFPTKNSTLPLSDISPNDLHPIELKRLKYRNTTEFQNLYNPNPYISINHLSYQKNNITTDRAKTAIPMIRKGTSGYCSNSIVHAGPPGDARTFKTGKTENKKVFKNPELGFRGHIQATPNVMERSGFWGH